MCVLVKISQQLLSTVVRNKYHIPAIPSAAAKLYRRFSVAGVILRDLNSSKVILPSSSASLQRLPINSFTLDDNSWGVCREHKDQSILLKKKTCQTYFNNCLVRVFIVISTFH